MSVFGYCQYIDVIVQLSRSQVNCLKLFWVNLGSFQGHKFDSWWCQNSAQFMKHYMKLSFIVFDNISEKADLFRKKLLKHQSVCLDTLKTSGIYSILSALHNTQDIHHNVGVCQRAGHSWFISQSPCLSQNRLQIGRNEGEEWRTEFCM